MDRRTTIGALRWLIRDELRRYIGGARRGPIREYRVRNGMPYVDIEGYVEERLEGAFAEPFGLASRPPLGTGAVAVKSGGQHVIVGVEDREHRPEVSEGRVTLYNAYGQTIELKNASISLNSGSTPVARQGEAVDTSNLYVSVGGSDLPVQGAATVAGGTGKVLVP